ncbi:hypothetical protein GOBAR_DD22991 [Gossypium barbadense]|nr:hypothetical protein GOBAR_DD22991 [Gossypium barbadense]
MELLDDEDVETMVSFYCGNQSDQNELIQLFTELADVETTEDLIPLGEEHGAQELCMVVLISYVDSQSTVRGIKIDINAAPETDAVVDDGCGSSASSDHEVDNDSDPEVDEIPNDIDDESVNDNENVNTSSVRNQIRRIVIYNNPRAHMSLINPYAAHATEFAEYPNILSAHRLVVDKDPEELFVGQKFEKNVGGRRKAAIGGYKPYLSKSRRCGRYENLLGLTYALHHENKFLIMPDLSTWKVPSMTSELVPEKGLLMNMKGCPQSSKIHNEMDIREKSDGKCCGVYKLASHNRSKCPQ